MSYRVILSLFSKNTHETQKPSPKNYPLSAAIKLVELLKQNNIISAQVGVIGEPDLNADEKYFNLPFNKLKDLLLSADTFICVDNFCSHMAHYYGKHGIVIFSKSDPLLFGYSENVNLLKDRKYLVSDSYGFWESVESQKEAFIEPEIVLKAVLDWPKLV